MLPSEGSAQIRIFNTLNCRVNVTIQGEGKMVNPLSMWANLNVQANRTVILPYEVDFEECNIKGYPVPSGKISGKLTTLDKKRYH